MNESMRMDAGACQVKDPRAMAASPLILDAATAADLMTPHVVSIADTATLQEAAALLTEKNLGAVPVMDEHDRAVGVLSRSDIVAYDCATYAYLQPGLDSYKESDIILRLQERWPDAFPVAKKACRVRDIMTGVIFSVGREVSAGVVIDAMLTLTVHRLFVTNEDGEVLGVISAIDVLRHLHQQQSPAFGQAEGPVPSQ